MMEWASWAVQGRYSHSSRVAQGGEKRSLRAHIYAVSWLYFARNVETIVKSLQYTWQRAQAQASVYMGKLHKEYE